MGGNMLGGGGQVNPNTGLMMGLADNAGPITGASPDYGGADAMAAGMATNDANLSQTLGVSNWGKLIGGIAGLLGGNILGGLGGIYGGLSVNSSTAYGQDGGAEAAGQTGMTGQTGGPFPSAPINYLQSYSQTYQPQQQPIMWAGQQQNLLSNRF
jgi:hypothetical protein